MSTPTDGGPAFPCSGTNNAYAPQGMSLRDWLAGQALMGLIANQTLVDSILDIADRRKMTSPQIKAVYCYEHADAMLKEREKHE